jgi:hypothetical protein
MDNGFVDVFQGLALDDLRKKAAHLSDFVIRQSRTSGNQLRRLETLEYNFGRMLLLLHTLSETALRNGVVPAEQLTAVYRELDLRDGIADDRLDPSAVPGMRFDATPPDTNEFLASLGSKPEVVEPQDPADFLKTLERTDGIAP